MKRRIYLDLDGVMADFDHGFQQLFGRIPHHDLTDDEWAEIHKSGTFFRDLPVCADALQIVWRIPDPIILTACPRTGYHTVANQKRAWVRQHIGDQVTVLPVLGSHNKPVFMHSPRDILIDDYGKNCRAWREAGGFAIKHESVQGTLEQLNEALA